MDLFELSGDFRTFRKTYYPKIKKRILKFDQIAFFTGSITVIRDVLMIIAKLSPCSTFLLEILGHFSGEFNVKSFLVFDNLAKIHTPNFANRKTFSVSADILTNLGTVFSLDSKNMTP